MTDRPERNNEPGVRIAGTPRSLRELAFAAGSRPCAHCGTYSELHWKHLDSEPVWRTTATCPKCGNARVYLFTYTDDLTDVDPPELQLGEGTSTVLDPSDLLGVIERVEPTITTPLVSLSDDTEQNWDRVERVQTALNELAKFVPAGATEIPASALRSGAGRAHHASHPDRYTKRWIDDEIARYAKLVDEVIPARPAPSVQRRGTIDRATLSAHREWYRTGSGTPLDVVGGSAREVRLDGSQIQRGRFESVDFTRADINQSDWSEVQLRSCNFSDAKLNRAVLAGSVILDCIFDRVAAAMVDVSKATVTGSSFDGAGMPGSNWSDVVASATRFTGASFGNARWDRARFVDCDFRDASLEPDREMPPTRMRAAVFEGCDFRGATLKGTDLRGVTFKRCKLAGARGEPKYLRDLIVEDCDVSLAELESQLVLPTIEAADLRANPSYVVARDREQATEAPSVVFEVGKAGARRIARTGESPTAVTYGQSRVVWLPTDQTFSVWSSDSLRLVVSRTDDEVRTPGLTLPIAAVGRIASFVDRDHLGRRGVALITPSRDVPRLVFIQEHDMIANDDRSYTLADARRDGAWAAALGRELAEWLRVPHDELREDLK